MNYSFTTERKSMADKRKCYHRNDYFGDEDARGAELLIDLDAEIEQNEELPDNWYVRSKDGFDPSKEKAGFIFDVIHSLDDFADDFAEGMLETNKAYN